MLISVHTIVRVTVATVTLVAALALVSVASAHPHSVTTGNGDGQVIADGQNHPGFVFNAETGQYEACEGVNEPANAGPAGYGLETAHHGRDQGTPGKADGCFALSTPPSETDNNPAID